MLWEPRVTEPGRETVEDLKEDENGKRRASVLSLSLSWPPFLLVIQYRPTYIFQDHHLRCLTRLRHSDEHCEIYPFRFRENQSRLSTSGHKLSYFCRFSLLPSQADDWQTFPSRTSCHFQQTTFYISKQIEVTKNILTKHKPGAEIKMLTDPIAGWYTGRLLSATTDDECSSECNFSQSNSDVAMMSWTGAWHYVAITVTITTTVFVCVCVCVCVCRYNNSTQFTSVIVFPVLIA